MRCAFVPLDRATCKPLTIVIVPALQAAMAAQDKASRLAHADRKRNLSEHRSVLVMKVRRRSRCLQERALLLLPP